MPSLHERMYPGKTGIVVPYDMISIYDFVDSASSTAQASSPAHLWIQREAGPPEEILVPGDVRTFYWSRDGRRLSIVYKSKDLPDDALSQAKTSLGVYDMAEGAFRPLAEATTTSAPDLPVFFTGGEWLANGRMHVRRVYRLNAWASRAEWATIDVGAPRPFESLAWTPIEHDASDVIVECPHGLCVRRTVAGTEGLYELSAQGLRPVSILDKREGAARYFAFDKAYESAVFVHETLTSPPEIYWWRTGKGARAITHFNDGLAKRISVRWREVRWTGEDGRIVHGWLIVPRRGIKPLPLVTFVHGGPGIPLRNEFADIDAKIGRGWPFPFLAYAEAGIAVFMPNYRGTAGYGSDFRAPPTLDGVPASDITLGIEELIKQGLADRKRLGIAGYSHGAWLAPIVMTRYPGFRAAVISEGSLNSVVTYSLMPAWLNREVHDINRGVSLYDRPQAYIDDSPELHLQGLDTAILFEAGSLSLAANMMSAPKAAACAGMPTEFVVYPRTGHILNEPRLQLESVSRTLDWFRYWLQGQVAPR